MHQILSANHTSTMFDVCERLVPLRAVSVHTAPGSPYSSTISVRGGRGWLLPVCCLSVGFACLWVDLVLVGLVVLSVCWFCLFVSRLSFSRFVSASRVS